jgi:ferric-chelate reductase
MRKSYPAKPSTFVSKSGSFIVQLVRKVSYPQWSYDSKLISRIPPLGSVIMIVLYVAYILGLNFYQVWVQGAQHYEMIGLRAGWLALAQFPLVILLAGKNNLIGIVTGVSYERLQLLHRWVGRGMLVLVIFHWAFQSYEWSLYGLVSLESRTDQCIPTGNFTILE